MNSLKTVFRITAQNFRKWQTDYRIWIIALFLIIMTLIYVDDVKKVSDYTGGGMSVWIFPFLYSQFYTKVLFTLPVILMFCDAPFVDKNQLFIMMRTTRTKWLCGQLLYIVLASGIYYLFIFAVSILSTVFYGDFSLEWGKTLNMLAYSPEAAYDVKVYSLTISRIVVEYFTPLLACFYTFILSWLSAIFLGLVVFVCNLFTGSRIWGIAASSFFIILSISAKGIRNLDRFSPISWSTLDGIDVGGLTFHPDIVYCLCAFASLIGALAAAVIIFGRRKSFDTKGN